MSPRILVSGKDPHVRDMERKAQGGLFGQRCTVLGKQVRVPQGGLQLVRTGGRG